MNSYRGFNEVKVARIIIMVAGGLAFFVVMAMLFGFFVQFLWNNTLSDIFKLEPVSFWQAVGLFILAKLFFGFGAGSQGSSRGWGKWSKKGRDNLAPIGATFREYWKEEGKAAYEAYRQKGDSLEADPLADDTDRPRSDPDRDRS